MAFFAAHGITRVVRVVTDDGNNYRAQDFTPTVEALTSRHQRIRPYTPKHNGKVERYQHILAVECLYARACETEVQRREAIAVWVHHDNDHRPHTACAIGLVLALLAGVGIYGLIEGEPDPGNRGRPWHQQHRGPVTDGSDPGTGAGHP